MNNVQQAIRVAAEKGEYRYRWWKVNDLEQNEGYNALQLRALSEHFHDPDFWKALATARKWEDVNALALPLAPLRRPSRRWKRC
jgi:hypothetical protein